MHVAVHHQQVVADIVEFVEVAADGAHRVRRDGAHFLVEDFIAQPLRQHHFVIGFG